jgi:prepilin-type processing-associated H-X9-DG protein
MPFVADNTPYAMIAAARDFSGAVIPANQVDQGVQILVNMKYITPRALYCPGRGEGTGDRFTYDAYVIGWPSDNWREISYMVAHSADERIAGGKDYRRWHKVGKSPSDLILAAEVCYTDSLVTAGIYGGPLMPYGWSQHGHGKGYNMVFFDGSGRFVPDQNNLLEPTWVIAFRANNSGHRQIMTTLIGWSSAQYDAACP